MMLKQLDIYWTNSEPTKGSETRKKRPCVILSSNAANANSNMVIVAPFLPGHKDWIVAVNVKPTEQNGLDKDRYLHLKQIRSVDISRLSKRQGALSQKHLPEIHDRMKLIFGIIA